MELENVLSNQTGSNILIWKLNMIIINSYCCERVLPNPYALPHHHKSYVWCVHHDEG